MPDEQAVGGLWGSDEGVGERRARAGGKEGTNARLASGTKAPSSHPNQTRTVWRPRALGGRRPQVGVGNEALCGQRSAASGNREGYTLRWCSVQVATEALTVRPFGGTLKCNGRCNKIRTTFERQLYGRQFRRVDARFGSSSAGQLFATKGGGAS